MTLFASFLSCEGILVTLKALLVLILINDDKLLCRSPARPDDAAEDDCRFSNFQLVLLNGLGVAYTQKVRISRAER